MLTVKKKTMALALLAFSALACAPAWADTVSIKGNSPAELKDKCTSAGGTFMPPGSTGAYGCVGKNGGVVVCGGSTPKQQRTCDTAGRVGPNRQLIRNAGVQNRTLIR